MKKILIPILLLGLFDSLSLIRAQTPAPGSGYAAVQQVQLSPQQLEELVAPIALYPDPLIALILPASTVPTDVVLAARYLRDGKDVNQVDAQNWDPSVKSLTRYPEVLNMMDENLDWTNQLGTAVIAQQGDVMQAIQNQRARANALGNLTSTPQQQVVVEEQIIQIVPADPEIIYVPQYNPEVVYIERAPVYSPFITFGAGFAMGVWLTNDCDWNHRGFYVNNWGHSGWHGYPRYNNVNVVINQNSYWRPNTHRPPPRPSYVPNRVSAVNNQSLPTFRQPSRSGGNGGNSWSQSGQGNRPPGVTTGTPNSQPGTNRTNTASSFNPAGDSRPGERSPGTPRPQNNPNLPQTTAVPNADRNNHSGFGGNNGQATREDSRRDRSPSAPVNPVPPSTQVQSVVPPEKVSPQPVVASQPRPSGPSPQPTAAPNPDRNNHSGFGGNNGQATREDPRRDRSPSAPVSPVPPSTQVQSVVPPEKVSPQPVVASQPRPSGPSPQPTAAPNPDRNNHSGFGGNNGQATREDSRRDRSPASPAAQPTMTSRPQPTIPASQAPAGSQTSAWRNSPQPASNAQPQQRRAVEQPAANPRGQQRTSGAQPVERPQGQPQPTPQRPAHSPPAPQQNAPKPARQAPQAQTPGAGQPAQDGQQGWQRKQ